MSNELLLVLSIFIYFGGLIALYKLFGMLGLYIWNAIALVLANIEVLLLVDAFGLTMTLGNVCFATTFLVTDLLSEKYGKKAANKAVVTGFIVSAMYVLISQLWLAFSPSQGDFAYESFKNIFSASPRIVFAGLAVYVISQFIDIKIYHFIWSITKRKSQSSSKYLWVRNNGSTLISQFINATLFNIIAFYQVFSNDELISIIISTYIIYVVISLIDTPFLYLTRKINPKYEIEFNRE